VVAEVETSLQSISGYSC